MKSVIYLLPLNFKDIENLIKSEKIKAINNRICPFNNENRINTNYFCLIGRHNTISSETWSEGDNEITKSTYKIQGAYIPISDKTYNSFEIQLKILNFLFYLFVVLLISAIPTIILYGIFSDNSFSDAIPGWQIAMFFSIIPATLLSYIKDDIIKNFSKLIINTNNYYNKVGIPDFDGNIYLNFITKNEIENLLKDNKIIKVEI